MRFIPILAIFFTSLFPLFAAPVPAFADGCEFVLGFKALHDAIPNIVGDCVVAEHHGDNGDALQETITPAGVHGLLVWRKADNWTAFTDGYHTWINGPYGVQERLNTQCFAWEGGCNSASSGTSSGSSSSSGTTAVTFTSIVGAAPGGTATISIQTTPNTWCTIDYWGPHDANRYEFGDLHRKQSDANGNVSWTWQISRYTALGSGTVSINCNGTTITTPIQIGTTPVTVAFSAVTGAAPGGTASVSVQTSPGAFCSIDYVGPQGKDRFEGGSLHLKQADSNGVVSWSWLVSTLTPAGNGTVTVNCAGVSQTATVPIS